MSLAERPLWVPTNWANLVLFSRGLDVVSFDLIVEVHLEQGARRVPRAVDPGVATTTTTTFERPTRECAHGLLGRVQGEVRWRGSSPVKERSWRRSKAVGDGTNW